MNVRRGALMATRSRELDRRIAEKFYGLEWIQEEGDELHGWDHHPADPSYPPFISSYFGPIPRYSEDLKAVKEVERRIEKYGCRAEYLRALEALGASADDATAEQRCRAALDIHPVYARRIEAQAAEDSRRSNEEFAKAQAERAQRVGKEGNISEDERDRARANKIINDIADRIWRLREERAWRFVETTREDAWAYLSGVGVCMGLLGRDVNALQKLNTKFPRVFVAYLKRMGRERGEFFAGSDAEPYLMHEYKQRAVGMLKERGVKSFLGRHSVVFLCHQGYSFLYFEGGDPSRFDSPVYQYIEGEPGPKRISEGFAELLDAELSLMEENNRAERAAGGYFITVKGGSVRRVYPARGGDKTPLEAGDHFI